MRTDVARRIRDAIAERGPLQFAEFMEMALYGEDGFYDRPPVGPDADFVTSPHVHWWFAYALALALGELQRLLGEPSPARILEVGAGDGTLARTLLEIVREGGPIEYVAVERSRGAMARLRDLPIRVEASVSAVAPLRDVTVFANELLDNLPFRRVRRARNGSVAEVRVDAVGTRFVEIEVDAEPGLVEAAGRLGSMPGEEKIVPTGAFAFIDELARSSERAYALLIDYTDERVRSGDLVHGYRDQRVVADVLRDPGSSDITAGVDLDAVSARASAVGLEVLGRSTQRDVLLALGFDGWAERQRERQAALGTDGRGVDATRMWASRSRASLLIDPAGLGRLSWLLLATRGLPAPTWLSQAATKGG